MSALAPPASPVQPVKYGLDDTIQFRCRKGIGCFNQCCQNIDILLTPYDILRLKNHLHISAREFIDRYTVDVPLDAHGLPGLKLKTQTGSPACRFVTEQGCSVYENRPAACRYYALGSLTLRRWGESRTEDAYVLVREAHCLGHEEPRHLTVRDYRREQGIEEYDAANRPWYEAIVKKRSSGPTIGTPSARSLELFFIASYDLEAFARFIASPGFDTVFDMPIGEKAQLLADEVQRLHFGQRLLRQVLFGEKTIPLRADAGTQRAARYRERVAAQQAGQATRLANEQDDQYASLE